MLEKEKALITRAIAGDQDAFTTLYDTHYPRVYALLLYKCHNRVEHAEELTQETFIQAFRKLPAFRNESRFNTWIHRIAINIFFMRVRRKDTETLSISLDSTKEDKNGESVKFDIPYNDTFLNEFPNRDALTRCIAQLPPGQKKIFMMLIQGYTHEEIALALGCSIGNSKSQVHRARMHLREMISNKRTYYERPTKSVIPSLEPPLPTPLPVVLYDRPADPLPPRPYLLPTPPPALHYKWKWTQILAPLSQLRIGATAILPITDPTTITRLRAMLYMSKTTGMSRWSVRRIHENGQCTGYSITKAGQFASLYEGQESRRLSRSDIARTAALKRFPVLQQLKPYLKDMNRWDKLGQAATLWQAQEGMGSRGVAKIAGLTKTTTLKLREIMLAVGILGTRCECGAPLGHRGWCAIRYKASPARQAVIQKWHGTAINFPIALPPSAC